MDSGLPFVVPEDIPPIIEAAQSFVSSLYVSGVAVRPAGAFVVLNAMKPFCSAARDATGHWTPGWRAALMHYSHFGLSDDDPNLGRYQTNAILKASVAWRLRADTLEVARLNPGLLEHGETRYAGGVCKLPFVVGFSGIQAELDHVVASMLAEALIARTRMRAAEEFSKMELERRGTID